MVVRCSCSFEKYWSSRFHQLHLTEQTHLVGNQHSARFERRIPVQAKILAIDFPRERKTCLCVAPRVFADAAKFRLQFDRMGHAVNGQFARERVAVKTRGFEIERWEIVGIKKISAAEVSISSSFFKKL